MQIKLIAIGKTDSKELEQLIQEYVKRLGFYTKFELDIIPDIKNSKNLSEASQKEKEGELILKKVQQSDELVLLDEQGKHYSSLAFSEYLQKKMNAGLKNCVIDAGISHPSIILSTFRSANKVNEVPACSKQAQKLILIIIKITKAIIRSLQIDTFLAASSFAPAEIMEKEINKNKPTRI